MLDHHEYITVFCGHCGFEISVPVYCKNRFCEVCSVHRNRSIRHKLSSFLTDRILEDKHSFKFLTLTIKNQSDLKLMTDSLLKSFRRLRQRKFWRDLVVGGASVIEVTHKSEDWHVHLHIVVESAYLPYKKLLAEWVAVSTGSGVFVKKIHSSQVIGYLTKYLTKDDVPLSEQKLMTDILKGRRLFQPFGEWHAPISKIPKLKCKCPKCESQFWNIGTIDQFFRKGVLVSDDECLEHNGRDRKSRAKQLSMISDMGYTANYALDW